MYTNIQLIMRKFCVFLEKQQYQQYYTIIFTNSEFFTDPFVGSFSQFCVQYSHLLLLSRVCQNFLSISVSKVFIQKFAVQGISQLQEDLGRILASHTNVHVFAATLRSQNFGPVTKGPKSFLIDDNFRKNNKVPHLLASSVPSPRPLASFPTTIPALSQMVLHPSLSNDWPTLYPAASRSGYKIRILFQFQKKECINKYFFCLQLDGPDVFAT